MTAGLTETERQWVLDKQMELIGRWDRGGKKPIVLLSRRATDQENPQHNTTPDQIARITTAADEHGFQVIQVPVGNQRASGDFELYAADEFPSRQRTAALWASIAALQEMGVVHGVVGGRSGSMDIAAFMGVNTAQWDLVDPTDTQCARLLQCHPILSILEMQPAGRGVPGELPMAGFNRWLAGERGVLSGQPRPQERPIDDLEWKAMGVDAYYLRDGWNAAPREPANA